MGIEIPSHLASAENEAIAYLLLAEHQPFARGFLQVTQQMLPADHLEGTLLEAARNFSNHDQERFSDVTGMPEIFESDDYELGVAVGVWAARKKREIVIQGMTPAEKERYGVSDV